MLASRFCPIDYSKVICKMLIDFCKILIHFFTKIGQSEETTLLRGHENTTVL